MRSSGTTRRLAWTGLCAAVLMAAQPAGAHHSSAMFDRAKTLVLTGTLKEMQFIAPHSWISIMVTTDTGEVVRWDIEGPTAGRLAQQGVTPARLKPGDKITVRTHPLRDGRKGGSLIELILADGGKFNNNTTRLQVGQ